MLSLVKRLAFKIRNALNIDVDYIKLIQNEIIHISYVNKKILKNGGKINLYNNLANKTKIIIYNNIHNKDWNDNVLVKNIIEANQKIKKYGIEILNINEYFINSSFIFNLEIGKFLTISGYLKKNNKNNKHKVMNH